MLPFGMFVYGEPRTVHTVCPACPESQREPRSAIHQSNRSASLILPPTRPLDFHHRRENPVTVCPLLATHTDLSPVSPVFATHTKTAGVYTNNSHFGTPSTLRPLDSVTLRPSVSTLRRGFLTSPLPCNNSEARMSRPKNFRVYFLLAALALGGLILLLREHRPSFLRPGLRLYAYVTTADGSITVVDLVKLKAFSHMYVGL